MGEAAPGATVPEMPTKSAEAPGNGVPARSEQRAKPTAKKKQAAMEPAPKAPKKQTAALDAYDLDAIMKEFGSNSA